MEAVELLMQFGLTRQEAAIYIRLTEEGELTGYETAKRTGISRSNAYGALAGLAEKGAAYVAEDTALHYLPVPVSEFCRNKIDRLEKARETLMQAMPRRRTEAEGYITIAGRGHIMDKARNMLRGAEARIYLSAAGQTLEQLLPELEELVRKGRKVVVITAPPFALEGAVVHYERKDPDQIGLIVDSGSVLTGELGWEGNALYSRSRNLVKLFKNALKNEITLIELKKGNPQS